jgi:hypothetical protein
MLAKKKADLQQLHTTLNVACEQSRNSFHLNYATDAFKLSVVRSQSTCCIADPAHSTQQQPRRSIEGQERQQATEYALDLGQ